MNRAFFLRCCWLLAVCLPAGAVYAECSSYKGKVVLNEVDRAGNPKQGNFIEVKLLQGNWDAIPKLTIGIFVPPAGSKPTPVGNTQDAVSCGSGSLWRTVSLDSNSPINNAQLTQFNVVLWEDVGGSKRIVDVLRVGSTPSTLYSESEFESCDKLDGAQHEGSIKGGNATKNWSRFPDGTGPWVEETASSKDTSCQSNGGDTLTCGKDNANKILLAIDDHSACSNQSLTVLVCNSDFYGKTQDLKFAASYVQPASGTRQARVDYPIAGGTGTINSLSTNPSVPSTLSKVKFDADGKAVLTWSYPDVGKLKLTATATAIDKGKDIELKGEREVVSAPASFEFRNQPATYVAGVPFNVKVAAMTTTGNACATPQVAPAFAQEGEALALLNPTRVLPAGAADVLNGPSDGVFTLGTLGAFSAGEATVTGSSWSEVGTLQLTLQVADGDYLGSGLNGSTQAELSRFIPHHFDTTLTPACGSFSYAEQPLTVNVTAENAQGNTTLNYIGPVAKNADLSAVGSSLQLADDSKVLAATSYVGGKGSRTIRVQRANLAPTDLKVRAVDSDKVSSNPAGGGIEGSSPIRQGRARLLNAHGSELLDLPMTFRTDYWDGSRWLLNSADTCTGKGEPVANTVSLKLEKITLPDKTTCVQDNGSPGRSKDGCKEEAPAARQFKDGSVTGFAGDFNLWLRKPDPQNVGAVKVDATVPAWLQVNGKNPSAVATFGLYRSGPVIYRRELY